MVDTKKKNWSIICLSQWRFWLILSASVAMLWHKWPFSISHDVICYVPDTDYAYLMFQRTGVCCVLSAGISWKCYFKKSCHAHIWILRGITVGKRGENLLSCVTLSDWINFIFHFYVHIMNLKLRSPCRSKFSYFLYKNANISDSCSCMCWDTVRY